MWFCYECGKRLKWCETLIGSYGRCEICDRLGHCNYRTKEKILASPKITEEEINKRFNHHPPTGPKIQIHENIRSQYTMLARSIVAKTPASREQSLAITALEESMFWANAAVARNPLEE